MEFVETPYIFGNYTDYNRIIKKVINNLQSEQV